MLFASAPGLLVVSREEGKILYGNYVDIIFPASLLRTSKLGLFMRPQPNEGPGCDLTGFKVSEDLENLVSRGRVKGSSKSTLSR